MGTIRRVLACGVALAAIAMFGPFANAATTPTTFLLAAGTLSISAPASSNLGNPTVNAGDPSFSAQLGTVTVTDTRGALVASWTATVSSTDFTTGGGTSNEKVTNASVSYASGLLSTSGAGVFTPQLGATLSTSRAAATLTAGIGNNSASWNPTLTFTLQASQVAGTYTGTVTHSVA